MTHDMAVSDESRRDPATPAAWAERWQSTTAPHPGVRTVDVHTHVLVPESAEMTRPHFEPHMDTRTLYSSPVTRALNQEFYGLVADKYTDPATRLADMDAMGVDVQLIGLSPFHYFYWADADLAPRVAAVQNEAIAAMAAAAPHRLVGIGTLPWGHPEAAVVEACSRLLLSEDKIYSGHGRFLHGKFHDASAHTSYLFC